MTIVGNVILSPRGVPFPEEGAAEQQYSQHNPCFGAHPGRVPEGVAS
jgi:hypothetical protein